FAKITRDLTERKRAEDRAQALAREQAARVAAEAAERRAAFLAEVSDALSASLDYEQSFDHMSRIVVPQVADWCAVHLAEGAGAVRAVAVAHADPAKEAWARELQLRYPLVPEASHGVSCILRTGVPEFVPEIVEEVRRADARDDNQLKLLSQYGA